MSFCDNQTPTCDVCYENATLSDCGALTLTTGLADAPYYFTIIDKFGKGWTNQYSVVSGDVTLDTSNYSDGFFNPYAGKYEIFAHTLESTYTRLDLTISGSTYKCILFDVDVTCCV
jgi:hypothetical protein